MTRVSALVLSFSLGTLAFNGARSASNPLDDLLFAAISAPSSVSFSGVIEVVRIGSRSSDVTVYRVEHRAPGLTRRVYTAPSALSGESVLSNGDLTYSVDPHKHRIVETRNSALDDSTALDVNYALLKENYRIARTGSETFDGRSAIDLSLVSKYTGRATMLLRVDTVSKIVLDKQEFTPEGSLAGEERFEQIRYDAGLPSSDFVLPKGYATAKGIAVEELSGKPDRVVAGAGFATRAPHSLPDGFSATEADVVEMRGVRTLHLLYSDGLRTVSLFENVKASTLEATRLQLQSLQIGGRSAEYAEDGTTALLSWSDGSLHYTLVCEVGLIDLRRFASAITP
jgi:negative regulator of sigma E activity